MTNKKIIFSAVVYWGFYLAATMFLFESYGLTPASVGGAFGWLIVEMVRALIGLLLFGLLTEKVKVNGKSIFGSQRGRR